MKPAKLSTVEMLEQIPFRGRYIDSNYECHCWSCSNPLFVWYGSASPENQERMAEGLEGWVDCPSCRIKKGYRKSAEVVKRMNPYNAIRHLWYMGRSTGIDFKAAEEQEKKDNKMELSLEENEAKTKWYLDRMKV